MVSLPLRFLRRERGYVLLHPWRAGSGKAAGKRSNRFGVRGERTGTSKDTGPT
jgi:hypothetical protein